MKLFSQNDTKTIEEMINAVNERRKGYMACVLPHKKEVPGVLLTEEGSVPIASYSIICDTEEHAEVLQHKIMSLKKIPSLSDLDQIVKDEKSRLFLICDKKKCSMFCDRDNGIILRQGDEGYVYIYVETLYLDEPRAYLFTFDSKNEHDFALITKFSTEGTNEVIEKLMFRFAKAFLKGDK